jgi:hypothetical protein
METEQREQELEAFARACQRRYFEDAALFTDLLFRSEVQKGAKFDRQDKCIYIQESLTVFPSLCKILILHELIHSKLLKEHNEASHGDPFKTEIQRLLEAGAYNDLL